MPVDVLFGGVGVLYCYSLGVAKYLKERYNWENRIIYSVSGGLFAGYALHRLTPAQIEERTQSLIQVGSKLPWNPITAEQSYRSLLETLFVGEEWRGLDERFQLGVTQLPLFQRRVISGPFQSKEELIQACLSTSYIFPVFFSLPAIYWYVDGGASRNPPARVYVSAKRRQKSLIHRPGRHYSSFRVRTQAEALSLYHEGYRLAMGKERDIQIRLEENIAL